MEMIIMHEFHLILLYSCHYILICCGKKLKTTHGQTSPKSHDIIKCDSYCKRKVVLQLVAFDNVNYAFLTCTFFISFMNDGTNLPFKTFKGNLWILTYCVSDVCVSYALNEKFRKVNRIEIAAINNGE